jgi:hypothetical protein
MDLVSLLREQTGAEPIGIAFEVRGRAMRVSYSPKTALLINGGCGTLRTIAVWLLGVLLGIQLICEGVAVSSLAWQVRRSA